MNNILIYNKNNLYCLLHKTKINGYFMMDIP